MAVTVLWNSIMDCNSIMENILFFLKVVLEVLRQIMSI